VPAIVSDPRRLHVVALGATSNVTAPLPDPVAPLVSVIHALLLAAVHGHPGDVVTVLPPELAAAVNVWLVGDTAGEHELPAWVTLNVVPAMVRVPVRPEPVLGATSNVTDPFPVPVPPPVTVIHDALLNPVQPHPVATVTALLPLPPAAVKDCVVGEIEGEHEAAAWLTVNVAPAIVSVPVRLDATVFAATLNVAVPLPEPVAPPVMVIQEALLAAVHAQPVAAVIVLLPVPADALNA
jgi:hypothetical protein